MLTTAQHWKVANMIRVPIVAALLAIASTAHAQTPVAPAPDVESYVTAAFNPARAIGDAWRSDHRGCQLARLALSEGIGNGLALTLKHFIVSPRPCLGCAPDGMPSGHTMNSAIGFSSHPAVGFGFVIATAALRHEANRHTWPQVLAGAALGVGADYAGHLLRCAP